MIPFTCRCGYAFQVADDLAGGLVQCPQCKRLIDVPRLGELDSLDDQGIYRLDAPPVTSNNPERVEDLKVIFTRERFDDAGVPIDLRGDFSEGHGGPIPVESLGPLDKAAPRYDPITGELIRDIDVKPEGKPPPGIPVAKRVVIAQTHVDGIEIPTPGESWFLPGRMLKPVNLIVMGIILVAHLLAGGMALAIAAFYWILAPFWLLIHLLLLSHYANVIDETGPESKIDLPTPLRSVDWHDDTFGPFVKMLAAMAVCFGPGVLFLIEGGRLPVQIVLPVAGAMLLLGTIAFPAAALTTNTSGSLLNLRPDRLFGVMYVCGIEYLAVLLNFIVGGSLWICSAAALNLLFAGLIDSAIDLPRWINWPTTLGSLAVATYLMHLFACHLGLLYRKHHTAFPWMYQRHTRTRKKQALGFPVAKPARKPFAPPPTRHDFHPSLRSET